MAAKTDGIYQIKIKGSNYDLIDYDAQQKIADIQDSVGAAQGIASLDSSIKVPHAQLNMPDITSSVSDLGQVSFIVPDTTTKSVSVNNADVALKDGMIIHITFNGEITGTGNMTLSYNSGTALPIKVNKDGVLQLFEPQVISGTSKFLQAYTTLDLQYLYNNGTGSCWMIIGDPIVLSSESGGYTFYATGKKNDGDGVPLGTIVPFYKKINDPRYLYCDGSTFDDDTYPELYLFLGGNTLPDYREFALVGAEQNTTSSVIATHDVFTQGQEKDDCLQDHYHSASAGSYVLTGGSSPHYASGNNGGSDSATGRIYETSSLRKGTVTRGKRKAVYFYIKATSIANQTVIAPTDVQNIKDYCAMYTNQQISYSLNEIKTGATWVDGKHVYRKVVNCGALPNGQKSVAHGISNLDFIVNLRLMAKEPAVNSTFYFIPFVWDSANLHLLIGVTILQDNIIIRTNTDRSNFTDSYAIIEYTKTTD